jgi:hypothetical protein
MIEAAISSTTPFLRCSGPSRVCFRRFVPRFWGAGCSNLSASREVQRSSIVSTGMPLALWSASANRRAFSASGPRRPSMWIGNPTTARPTSFSTINRASEAMSRLRPRLSRMPAGNAIAPASSEIASPIRLLPRSTPRIRTKISVATCVGDRVGCCVRVRGPSMIPSC